MPPNKPNKSPRNHSRACPAITAERRETKNKIESQGIRQAGAAKKILICNHPGCKARALPLPDGRFIERCYDHASRDERAEYMKQWNVS